MATTPSRHTRVVCGGLTWPAIRGSRLLQALNSINRSHEEENEDKADESRSHYFPYDLELCAPTAGHLALVLVQNTPGVQLLSPLRPSAVTTSPCLTPSPLTSVPPRVVYVLDAIPPSKRGIRGDTSKKGTTAGVQLPLHHLNELELLEELFAPHSRAAGGKDGSVLIKAPLLCARFDCRVISIRFLRSEGTLNHARKGSEKGSTPPSSSLIGASSNVMGTAAPLRCIVAREDGMAYLWEWQGDLFQWVFLNKLCFLENPNLKWTRPVVAFTTSDLPLESNFSLETGRNGPESSGTVDLVWWSTAAKHDPKLKLRRLRFEPATDALRATDVVVGSTFIPKPRCNDVVQLLSSKLGLFAVSKNEGIIFRSALTPLKTVTMGWQTIFALDDVKEVPEMAEIMICVHNVTGELLIFHRGDGDVYVITTKSLTTSAISDETCENGSSSTLLAHKLTTLKHWQQQDFEVVDVAAHRYVFLVLSHTVLRVYTLVGGDLLETVNLPNAIATLLEQGRGQCKFWTISGSASSVGLWSPCGFWTIRLPPAKAVAAALYEQQAGKESVKIEPAQIRDPKAAFLSAKDYGVGDLQLVAVRYALDLVKKWTPAAIDPAQSHPEAWEAILTSISSPAFVLALLTNRSLNEHVVREYEQLVHAIYGAASNISSFGRLNHTDPSSHKKHLQRLTPANLEALQNLSNWILLAKRKLARLDRSSKEMLNSFKLMENRQDRAGNELSARLGNEETFSDAQEQKVSVVDPEDAHNFRLSRKLRPMSSLRFAAGCSTSSRRQGKLWLLQLESFLLDGVTFKEKHQAENACAEITPSHRLFHSERVLADFRHVGASSFSKHMYLESMSRLYLLHEPTSLLPFIQCVNQFCPRPFSLFGRQPLTRSHAERALKLFPPLKFFTDQVHRTKTSQCEAAAKASLLAYVDLLSYCGYHSDVCRALLDCHLYEESKRKFLLLMRNPHDVQHPGEEQEEQGRARATASSSVYFLLLRYCVFHCTSSELNALLKLKPAHVDILHVLRALRSAFYSKKQMKMSESARVTVGDMRAVLVALMQQQHVGKVLVSSG